MSWWGRWRTWITHAAAVWLGVCFGVWLTPTPEAVVVWLVAAFLVGASCGRWFSARKQVNAAVAVARAEAEANALAMASQQVVIGGRVDETTGRVDYHHDRSAYHHVGTGGDDDLDQLPRGDDDDGGSDLLDVIDVGRDDDVDRGAQRAGPSGTRDRVRATRDIGPFGSRRRGVGDMGPHRPDQDRVST